MQVVDSVDSVEDVENEIFINQKEIIQEVKEPRRKDKTATFNENQSKSLEIYGTHEITRKQAIAANILFYWSDKPCNYGHIGFRFTKGRTCRVCKIKANFKQRNPQEFEATSSMKDGKRKLEDLKLKREMEKIEKGFDYDFDI